MKNLLLLFLLLGQLPLWAQYSVTGTVVDQSSNVALPFVNIIFNNNSQLGTSSDIDGHFKFDHHAPLEVITLSYVGYQNDTIRINDQPQPLVIPLRKTEISTQEVVVIAGENPAYRIIRKAARNRQKHNPERIKKYTYDSYNKIKVYDEQNAPIIDTSQVKDSLNFYYSLIESLSEVKYIAPDKQEEHIVATRFSGFKDPTFMTAITQIQPLNFHRENFLIIDKEFLSPISKNATAKYEYRLEDTLYQGQDSIFLISFFPRKGSTFDALKGSMSINTNGYAIQHVIVEPAQKQKIQIRLQQQYTFLDSSRWFPEQLNFELEMAPRKIATYTIQGKRYIRNVDFEPALSPKDFSTSVVTMAEDATQKDSIYWKKHRFFALTNKEENTYKVIDKVGKKLPLDLIMSAFTELEEERVAIGPIAVNYTQVMEFNLHEQFRLGLGLYTSHKFSKYVTVGGYFAYGFKDKQWKWGASMRLRPWLNRDLNFEISYIDDVIEPAAILQKEHSLSLKVLPRQSFTRRNVLNQMDQTYELDLSVHFRTFRYLQTRIFANWSYKIPLYNYEFLINNEAQQKFKFARLGVQFRFAYKEKDVQIGSYKINAESRFPILYLGYTRGLKGVLDGQFAYDKFLIGLESSFFVKGWGRTNIFLQGGWIRGKVPYPVLFNGRGSFGRWRMFMVRNTFQTMPPNAFLVDKFAYLFIEHNFGSLLFNTKTFKPEVKIYQSFGLGWLEHQQLHQGIPIRDMRLGYFESGLMLSNIIRMNMLNFGWFGLGAGAFVRYGKYFDHNNILNNFAFKIDMSVSF